MSDTEKQLFWDDETLELLQKSIISEILPELSKIFLMKIKDKKKIISSDVLTKIRQDSFISIFQLILSLILWDKEILQKSKQINNFHLINDIKEEIAKTNIYRCLKGEFLKTDRRISYEKFTIQYFGRIYEELMNYQIEISENSNNDHDLYLIKQKSFQKSTGAFYTPEYIVKYIIENTLGPILDEKIQLLNTQLRETSKFSAQNAINQLLNFKILDPAMGTAYFLNTAVDYIFKRISLEFKRLNFDMEITERIIKRMIIENTIFGVDLDPVAVEISKITFLLQIIDEKTEKKSDFPLFEENFACVNTLLGNNSIISAKYDAVIGNPPYGAIFSKKEKLELNKRFETNSRDSSAYFIEKSIKLTHNFIGMIIPKSLAFYTSWKSIREYIIDKTNILKIGDPGIAFKEINYEELIIIAVVKKEKRKLSRFVEIDRFEPLKRYSAKKNQIKSGRVSLELITGSKILIFHQITPIEETITKNIIKNSIQLQNIKRFVIRGLYIPDQVKQDILGEPVFNFPNKKTSDSIIFVNKVPDVGRYFIKKYYIIPSNYLKSAKLLHRIEKVSVPKVFIKVLRGKRLIAFPDSLGEIIPTEKLVCLQILDGKYPVSVYFIAAVLNSYIPSWILQKTLFSGATETSRVMDDQYLKRIPFPKLNFEDEECVKKLEKIDFLVQECIELKTKMGIANQISPKEEEIYDIIFDLYHIDVDEKREICSYFK